MLLKKSSLSKEKKSLKEVNLKSEDIKVNNRDKWN